MSFLNKDIDSVILQHLSIHALCMLARTNKHYYILTYNLLRKYNYFFKSNKLFPPIQQFYFAAVFHYVDIAKYIFTKHNPDPDKAFEYACFSNDINIAKWLVANNNININKNDNYVFKITCYQGDLELAKWILTINKSIDINVLRQELLDGLNITDQKHVAEWLLKN